MLRPSLTRSSSATASSKCARERRDPFAETGVRWREGVIAERLPPSAARLGRPVRKSPPSVTEERFRDAAAEVTVAGAGERLRRLVGIDNPVTFAARRRWGPAHPLDFAARDQEAVADPDGAQLVARGSSCGSSGSRRSGPRRPARRSGGPRHPSTIATIAKNAKPAERQRPTATRLITKTCRESDALLMPSRPSEADWSTPHSGPFCRRFVNRGDRI